MSEMEFDIDMYEEELFKYIHERAVGDVGIESLSDVDISYLLSLWDEYVDSLSLDEEEEEFEVDSDALYDFVIESIKDDGEELEVDMDTLINLIEMEEDFVDALFEGEDE